MPYEDPATPEGVLTDEQAAAIRAAGGVAAAPPEFKTFYTAHLNQYDAFRQAFPRAVDLQEAARKDRVLEDLTLDFDKATAGQGLMSLRMAPDEPTRAAAKDSLVVESYIRSKTGKGFRGPTRALMRDAVATTLFGEGKGLGSDAAFLGEAKTFQQRRKDERHLIQGPEGDDEAASAGKLGSLTGLVSAAAMRGESFMPAYSAWLKGAKGKPGFDPESLDRYEAVAQTVHSELNRRIAEVTPAVHSVLAGLVGERDAVSGVYGGDAVVDELIKIPAADRPLALTLLAAKAQAIGAEKPEGWQLGEAFGRGSAAFLMISPARTMEMDALEDAEQALDKLKPGDTIGGRYKDLLDYADSTVPSLESWAGGMLLEPLLPNRTVTAEDITAARQQIKLRREKSVLGAQLEGLAKSGLDPLKAGDMFMGKAGHLVASKVIYPFAESIAPQIAMALLTRKMSPASAGRLGALVGGGSTMIPMYGLMADQNAQQLMQQNPAMDPRQAYGLARNAAWLQTGLEYAQTTLAIGAGSSLGKAIQTARASAWANFGKFAAAGLAEQNLIEATQDITPQVVQRIAQGLGGDVPEVDWKKVLQGEAPQVTVRTEGSGGDAKNIWMAGGKEFPSQDEARKYADENREGGYWAQRLDTFFALLPAVALGAGGNAFRAKLERGNLERIASNLTDSQLMASGIGEAQRTAILAETDAVERLKLLDEARNAVRRNAETDAVVREGRQRLRMEHEAQAAAQASAMQDAQITVERSAREGRPVWTVTRGETVTEHPSAGAAMEAAGQHMSDYDQEVNAPLFAMLEELDRNPLSPLQESQVTFRNEQTVSGFLVERAAVMQDENAAPEARQQAEREFDAMERRMKVAEAKAPEAPIDWTKMAVGGQSALKVRGDTAKAIISIAHGESPYTALEERTEAEAGEWVRTGKTTWKNLAGMIRQVEQVTGDTYLNGYTDGQDAAQDQTAVKEAYSDLAQVHATAKGRAGKTPESGIAGVARRNRKDARGQWARLKEAVRTSRLAAELVERLKAHVQWLTVVVDKARRLNAARRGAGGKLDIDEFLNRSIGIGPDMRHAAEVVEEAGRIFDEGTTYTPPTAEQEDDGIAFSLRPMGAGIRSITAAPEVLPQQPNPLAGETARTPREWRSVWKNWISENRSSWRQTVSVPEGEIAITRQALNHAGYVRAGESPALHFEAAARLPELLQNSVLASVETPRDYERGAAEIHRRYAWMPFDDSKVRNVLLTVKRMLSGPDADMAYSLEALEVNKAADGNSPATPEDPQADTGSLGDNLARFLSGVKNEHKTPAGDGGISFSLSSRAQPVEKDAPVRSYGNAAVVGPATFAITAYHGTPHQVDRFSTRNIGTGEGRQSFGWGIYFAQSRRTAEWYQEALSDLEMTADGAPYDANNERHLAGSFVTEHGTPAEAIAYLEGRIADYESRPASAQWARDQAASYRRQAELIQNGDFAHVVEKATGNLYTVEIIPDESEFLDWDGGENSPAVREALGRASVAAGYPEDAADSADGQGLMFDFRTIGSPQAVSEFLLAHGIRGIKYLDGVSRGKTLKEIKASFLEVLPENADFDSVMEEAETGAFDAGQTAFLKELEANDWLGFDYPAQAISAALSENVRNWDPSPELVAAVDALRGEVTRNFVVFSEADIKITERNGERISDNSRARAEAEGAEQEQAASFRLTPVDTLDQLARSMERRMRDPDARRRVFDQMKAAMDSLRRSWTEGRQRWNGEGRPVAEQRSKRSLDKEQAFREASAYAEAEESIWSTLTASAQAALGMTAEDTSAFAGPLAQRFSAGRFGAAGRIQSRSAAMQFAGNAEFSPGGEYDGAAGLPPMCFGGTLSADLAAQEAFDAGEIGDASPDALWDAMRRELQTQAKNRDAMQAAMANIKAAQKQAKASAKAEAAAWKADQDAVQSQDWDARAVMLRHMRTLDAIISALPPEIRSKVGGWTSIASLSTQQAMAKELENRLRMADEHLEDFLKQDAMERVEALMERAKPKREAGKKPVGKIGAEAHRFFKEAERVMALTPDQVREENVKLDAELLGRVDEHGILIPPDDDGAAALFERHQILDMFGALGKPQNHDAAHVIRALDLLEQVYVEGRNRWRMLEEARLAEVKGFQDMAVGTLAAAGISRQRILDAKDYADTLTGMLKMGPISLKSFTEVLETLLGRNHVLTVRWSGKVREGMAQKADEVLRVGHEWMRALETATGKRGRSARKAAWDMGKKRTVQVVNSPEIETEARVPVETIDQWKEGTADPAALGFSRAEARELMQAREAMLEHNLKAEETGAGYQDTREYLTLKQPAHGPVENVSHTEAEAVYLSMLWAQEAYKASLRKAGYGAEAQAQIEEQLSPAAKYLRAWLARNYADGYEPLARLFRNMFGVDLPRIENYAPGLFYNRGISETGLDISGAGIVEGGFRSGFIKDRTLHTAEPKAENAFQVFFGHVNQTAHWKALSEVTRELRGVFSSPDVQRAILARHGPQMLGAVNKWMESIEGNGLKVAHSKLGQFFYSMQAHVALAWKLGTIMKQSTALLGAAYRMPAADYLRGLGLLLAATGVKTATLGKVETAFWANAKAMWNSPMIRRRLAGGFSPEVRAALAGAFTGKPGIRQDFLRVGIETLGFVDAFFTTGSAAIAYDYHYRHAIAAGMTPEMAEATAMNETADIVARTAQPVEVSDRSLFEQSLGGLGKGIFMFGSEARQKSSMWLTAWGNTFTGKADANDLRVLVISHLIVGPMIQAITAAMRDRKDDDDAWDEKRGWLGFLDPDHWNPMDFLMAAATGPLSGIPLLRDLVDGFKGDSGPLSRFANAYEAGKDIIEGIPDGEREKVEWYGKKIAGVLQGLDSFTAVAAGIVDDAMRTADNLHDDQEETDIKVVKEAAKITKAKKAEEEKKKLAAMTPAQLREHGEQERQKKESDRKREVEKARRIVGENS
ncbi:MAG: hypothetical protein JWM59_1990 [Verrucomicrobiales bacterium]|nr:hypothetical protein [Verrucomicrobiales bacterium]